MLIHGFAPIADQDAEILILGSMPGRASLAAGQYYAHPRNAFWPIMAELLHWEAGAGYAEKTQALKAAKIALWDVLHACVRAGSLDARIESERLAVNDFPGFFRAHPKIRRVFCNGEKAASCYQRHVSRQLDREIPWTRLPSTSPANAAMPFARKLEAWRAIVEAPHELSVSP